MNAYFKDYAEYLGEFFPEMKVQKISVNSSGTCPNRDGVLGVGGCSYCDNNSFSPSYCMEGGSVSAQLNAGRRFFARKYPAMKYLAYFQSFTTTYGRSRSYLDSLWQEALDAPDVVGLVVGSRPDCMGADAVESLFAVARRVPVFVELGAESSHDRTLRRVNRGHLWRDTVEAVDRCRQAGLHVGLHLIAGLPGESQEDILETVDRVCVLPVESIKLHHLQILRTTPLFRCWNNGEFSHLFPSVESYVDFCVRVVERVPRSVAIERFLASSPPHLVAAPGWGVKNYEFTHMLLKRLEERRLSVACPL